MTGFDRRHFVTAAMLGAGAIAAVPAPARAQALPPLKAKLGHEVMGILDEKMALYLERFGVEGVGTAATITDPGRIYNSVDELKRMRELAEKHHLTMEIAECALPTQNVDQQAHPAINLGAGEQRDRDIESFQQLIRNCAAAGIPCIKYALNYLGAMRTSYEVPGRGDALVSGWRLADAPTNLPLTRAGVVPADLFWNASPISWSGQCQWPMNTRCVLPFTPTIRAYRRKVIAASNGCWARSMASSASCRFTKAPTMA